jgi:peptidoglycan/LPS O-acetylase OafA/YrhL
MVVFYHCTLFMAFHAPQAIESGRGAWVRAISNGFWSGIDIFFVLSGFLIGRILIVNLSRDGVLYYWAFIVRRSFRIFPAYYLVTTLSLFVIAPLDLPVLAYLFRTRDWGELARGSWANYFYLVNYVNPGNEPSVLSWACSLAVEEHFYLILPASSGCSFVSVPRPFGSAGWWHALRCLFLDAPSSIGTIPRSRCSTASTTTPTTDSMKFSWGS